MKWQPGTWIHWVFGPTQIAGAAVVCPQCGTAFSIGGGQPFGSVHAISADGAVHPSVVCTRCSWHTFIRLIGWPAERGAIA